jgi:hypothetical protein
LGRTPRCARSHARARTHEHAATHAHARAQPRMHSTHARATQARRPEGTQTCNLVTLTCAHTCVRSHARTKPWCEFGGPGRSGRLCMQVGRTSAVRAGFASDLFRLAARHWTSMPRVTGRVGLVALVHLNEIPCAWSELEVSACNRW